MPLTIRALLLAPLLMVAALAPLPGAASFVSGVWKGEANYDSDGNFRDCTMTAQSEGGVLLGFVISKDFDWGLVLADEAREFVVGSSHAVLLLVDTRDPIPAQVPEATPTDRDMRAAQTTSSRAPATAPRSCRPNSIARR